MDQWADWHSTWDSRILPHVQDLMKNADPGHDLSHVRRVILNATRIGKLEKADPSIVLPAAWLHDCVSVPKNSPQRSQASTLAATQAMAVLKSIDYPTDHFARVEHAIQSHSFSAGIPPQTMEAKVLQDADRLEAVGAIGLARCLMTGGSLAQQFVHEHQPFPIDRVADDKVYSIDHLFLKLLGLHRTMQTEAGRLECQQRTQFLRHFLEQLAKELHVDDRQLEASYLAFGL